MSSKVEKRKMVMITAGNKIYSDDSVKRYADKIITEVKGLIEPFKKMNKVEKRILKGIELFRKTGIVTAEEMCRMTVYIEHKRKSR